jgi:hypothetical protein
VSPPEPTVDDPDPLLVVDPPPVELLPEPEVPPDTGSTPVVSVELPEHPTVTATDTKASGKARERSFMEFLLDEAGAVGLPLYGIPRFQLVRMHPNPPGCTT